MPENLENAAVATGLKRSVYIPVLRKAMSKNVETTAHLHSLTHASKVILKILQARLQQYMNQELPDVQAGFRKGRGTRNQIPNICWHGKRKRVPEKHLFLLY